MAVQGRRARPILILASTSSSQASGAAVKPAACSHTQESACSDPQLRPTVPRHPDTPTGWPSTSSVPVTSPSGTLATGLVRGSGARYSTAGRSGRSGGCPPVMLRSQDAVRSPRTALPRNCSGPAAASGGKTPKTCLTTTGRWPRASRPWTILAVRRMAGASSTEVPPNFMTTGFMRRRPRDRERCPGFQVRRRAEGACPSRPGTRHSTAQRRLHPGSYCARAR